MVAITSSDPYPQGASRLPRLPYRERDGKRAREIFIEQGKEKGIAEGKTEMLRNLGEGMRKTGLSEREIALLL